MIALNRSRAKSKVTRAWRGQGLRDRMVLLIETFLNRPAGEPPKFGDAHSRKWKVVKKQLKAETHDKCAYCEASTANVAHGDVEHFRPKSKFWWLAFCYDNYLYSCQICNQSFKSNNWTAAGAPLAEPAMPAAMPTGQALDDLVDVLGMEPTGLTDADLRARWDAEEADLVNPYLEDPEKLFIYELDEANGEVWVRSAGTPRANRAMTASDDFLGLNREELRRDRYPFARQLLFIKVMIENGLDATGMQIAEQEVVNKQQAEESYAGMARFFAREWNLPGAMPEPAG